MSLCLCDLLIFDSNNTSWQGAHDLCSVRVQRAWRGHHARKTVLGSGAFVFRDLVRVAALLSRHDWRRHKGPPPRFTEFVSFRPCAACEQRAHYFAGFVTILRQLLIAAHLPECRQQRYNPSRFHLFPNLHRRTFNSLLIQKFCSLSLRFTLHPSLGSSHPRAPFLFPAYLPQEL